MLVVALADAAENGYPAQEVEFESHGVRLAGSIVLPKDSNIRAAVVFVHGSGKQARNLALAKRFASEGVAALVYDKRGRDSGSSATTTEASPSTCRLRTSRCCGMPDIATTT